MQGAAIESVLIEKKDAQQLKEAAEALVRLADLELALCGGGSGEVLF